MIEARRFGPHADDAQGLEHWAAAGATALAAVVVSPSEGEGEGRAGGAGGAGAAGARVVVWWAGPDGCWIRSPATPPCCFCCCSGEEGEGGGGEGGERTPSPSKGAAAAASAQQSPPPPPPPPPLLAADVAASADGGLRVLTLSSSSSWNASVVSVSGDPTAVSDSGRALSPWAPPRRVGGRGAAEEGGRGGPLAPPPGTRAALSTPLGAQFVPGTGGSSVLLTGVGEDDGALFVVRLDCSFEGGAQARGGTATGDCDADDDGGDNPGFVPPPRLEDARWRPVATWEIPAAAAAAAAGGGTRGEAGAEAGAGAEEAALLCVSPEGATALVRAAGGGLFALALSSSSACAPRPLSSPSPSPSSSTIASAPVIVVGAAFSPTGECAAAVGSTGSVVVLPAAAAEAAAAEAAAAAELAAATERGDPSPPRHSRPSLLLGRAAARRLCWALTNNLTPLGPALCLSAAPPEARRAALALLQRAVALHPWASRPAVAAPASRAAAAVCRLARSRCSAAAPADSPEAVLEADLLTELRVGDVDAAVRAALVAGSSRSPTAAANGGDNAGRAPSPSSSRPLPSLAASDALLLAPALAWAEAVALWLLLSARHWAARRAAAAAAEAAAAAAAEQKKREGAGASAGTAKALSLAASANRTPGVGLLASTAFLGALRQAVAAGLALPAEAAEEAERWLREALCLSRDCSSTAKGEGVEREGGGGGGGEAAAAAAAAAATDPPSWLASWALSAARASRLRALAASLAELTGRAAPAAAEIDVAGATAELVLASAASVSSVPRSLSSASASPLGPRFAEPLAAPLCRAGGALDPRKVLGVFAAAAPGSAVSAWADSTPREWLLREGERPPPRPPAPFLRAPLGVAVASSSSPSASSSSSSSPLAAAAAARSTGAAPLPPLPSDLGAGALAPLSAERGSGGGAAATAARRRRWASDRAGSAAAVAAAAAAPPPPPKEQRTGAPSPSAALGPLRQPQRQRLDALTWRLLDAGGGGGGGGVADCQPALVSADGGSTVSASTVAAAAAAAAAAVSPAAGGGSIRDVAGVLLFGSWGAAAPPTGGGWFAA